MASTTVLPAGVSAHQGAHACTSKKKAPERRTARNTSERASMETSQDVRASTQDVWSFVKGPSPITLCHVMKVSNKYFYGDDDDESALRRNGDDDCWVEFGGRRKSFRVDASIPDRAHVSRRRARRCRRSSQEEGEREQRHVERDLGKVVRERGQDENLLRVRRPERSRRARSGETERPAGRQRHRDSRRHQGGAARRRAAHRAPATIVIS